MKICDDDKKMVIYLDDGDILDLKTLKGNPITMTIKCLNGCLTIDEVHSKRIKEINMEQEQLKALEIYNKKRKKGK